MSLSAAISKAMRGIGGSYKETKFGSITDIAATTVQVIAPFQPTYLTTASLIRIKAGGDVADDSAGTGAQSITCRCLDVNYNKVFIDLVTNGTSASASSDIAVLRVLSAWTDDVGSGEVNADDITIEAVTGGSTQALIPAGEGQTQQLFTTIPAGHVGYMMAHEYSIIDKQGGVTTQHQVHVRFRKRLFGKGWRTIVNGGADTDGGGSDSFPEYIPEKFTAKTDIQMTAYSHVSGAEVNGRFWLMLERIK